MPVVPTPTSPCACELSLHLHVARYLERFARLAGDAERAGVIVDCYLRVAIGPSSLAGVEYLYDSESP